MAEDAPPEEPGGSSQEPSGEVTQGLNWLIQANRSGRGEAAELQDLPPERAAAVEDQLQDTRLKETYAHTSGGTVRLLYRCCQQIPDQSICSIGSVIPSRRRKSSTA